MDKFIRGLPYLAGGKEPFFALLDHSLHTAILVFGRTAATEAAHKRFVQRPQSNRRIATQLLRHSLSVADSSGLPYFLVDSRQQSGASFGERLANALEAVFARGFAKVVCIGTDTPELHSDHLAQAVQTLDHQPMVLGPSTDGGVYLIGLERDTYHRGMLLDIRWETEMVISDWKHYQQLLHLSCHWLPALMDLDNYQDLLQCIRRLNGRHWLARTFHSLQGPAQWPLLNSANLLSIPFFGTPVLRGPPVL